MARPGDFKIIKDNRSSYNLIAHEHHVPRSPLFGPGPEHMRGSPRREYEDRGAREERDQGVRFVDSTPAKDEWENVQEVQTSRRAEPDYKVRPDYRSSYDLIQHEHHVPASPLYRPGQGRAPDVTYSDPRFAGARGGGYEGDQFGAGQGEQNGAGQGGQYGAGQGGHYGAGQGGQYGAGQSGQYGASTLGRSLGETIGQINHLPVSPLYRPGQGQGLDMSDPRYGSAQGQRQFANHEVPRPKDPPTPDYNTQQRVISENNHDDDTKLQLDALRGSQEDLSQDRPKNQGPPKSDRPNYGGDRSYREQPWTQRNKTHSDIADPRIGAHHDGLGLVGSRNGGALLFIRFPIGQGENVQVAAQAFLKSKTHDNGGRFLGLAKKVFDFGYEKGPTEAMGVFHFPTTEKAFLFFQMDPIIRQPDFPPPYGHAEMWIVSNAYLPDNLQLFSTFLLSEVQLHSGKEKREFFETFQKPFESYLYKNGAMPFVICSYGAFDRKSLRRHTYPPSSIVTCHLFQGLDHLNWITNDETYSKFRSLHNQMATEKCSIFTLSKDMFP